MHCMQARACASIAWTVARLSFCFKLLGRSSGNSRMESRYKAAKSTRCNDAAGQAGQAGKRRRRPGARLPSVAAREVDRAGDGRGWLVSTGTQDARVPSCPRVGQRVWGVSIGIVPQHPVVIPTEPRFGRCASHVAPGSIIVRARTHAHRIIAPTASHSVMRAVASNASNQLDAKWKTERTQRRSSDPGRCHLASSPPIITSSTGRHTWRDAG
jgi:hypothetical protein